MIPGNDVRATLLQPRHHVVGKPILEDTVAEAEQFIDIPHNVKGQVQPLEVAVKIRHDPDFQWSGSVSGD